MAEYVLLALVHLPQIDVANKKNFFFFKAVLGGD